MGEGREELDASVQVRAGEELDAVALAEYLRGALPNLEGPLAIAQFPSGYSNLTYLVSVGDTELVLRRPPVGSTVRTAHDMGREFRVLKALAPLYAPAPRPLGYCADASILGAPFYVMERRKGAIVRRKLPAKFRGDPGLFRNMCTSLVDALAELHAVDVAAAGLEDFGKPAGYVRRQVEGWIARFERAKTSEVPEIDELGVWLRENMPPESGATLVHNDFKFDNVMLDTEDPTKIVAVLDWELCTIGDPLMDLGTTLGYWVEPSDEPQWQAMAFAPTTAPGALTRREVVERYHQRTGRDVSNMLYYYGFALLKIAGIAQQIFYRYQRGTTADPRFASLDQAVAALARTSRRAIDSGRY